MDKPSVWVRLLFTDDLCGLTGFMDGLPTLCRANTMIDESRVVEIERRLNALLDRVATLESAAAMILDKINAVAGMLNSPATK